MLVEWVLILTLLLLFTKWRDLGRLLRHAVALIVLDRGFVILAQISIPLLTVAVGLNKGNVISQGMLLLGLCQSLNFAAIVYRLYCLRTSRSNSIISCYYHSFTRVASFFLLMLLVTALVLILVFVSINIQLIIFKYLQVNLISKLLGVLSGYLFLGTFVFFTYFTFILVIAENKSPWEAVVMNFQMMKNVPITLLLQIIALWMLPGPFFYIQHVSVAVGAYLWLLVCMSLSVVVYHEQKLSSGAGECLSLDR